MQTNVEKLNNDVAMSHDAQLEKMHWNTFKLYNGYRLLIALTLLLSHNAMQDGHLAIGTPFKLVALAYIVFGFIAAISTWFEKPALDITLPTQIIVDIVFILLLMHLDANNQAVMGLLLVIAIASASLISDGRFSLFYAAVATIGILLQQFFAILLQRNGAEQNYTSAVILSLACFAIAWLAHHLASRMLRSEKLASQRGVDLQDLAKINALITHKMKDGVIVVNQNLYIKHHNQQADAFLNLDGKHWEDKSLDILAPDMAKLLSDWFDRDAHLETNVAPMTAKINMQSRELQLTFLPIAEDSQQGAVIFIEDWSQVQTQSHQVKLAALGRLTAKIAHEIRNPLSSISHANQLLQEEEDIEPATQRMLQIIEDNVERVDQIIKDVLELNRRDRTNQELINLQQFMTEFHQAFCAVENITDQQFTLSIESDDNHILFDHRHLNQILWNLCKNGWRHSQQQKGSLRARVSTQQPSTTLSIEVSDNGTGIPDNIQNQLFEPFFTTENAGTGLGLYISRELAEANGASLQYKPSDIGAKFVIQIKKAKI